MQAASDQRCILGAWSEWSPCTKDCRPDPDGPQLQPYQWRMRTVTPRTSTDDCQDVCVTETRLCGDEVPLCQTQACEVGAWSDWSNCSEPGGDRAVDCGEGFSMSTREITKYPRGHDPEPCPELVRYRKCSRSACEMGCQLGPWSPWSACTSTCGDRGTRSRSRTGISNPGNPRCGLKEMGTHLFETQECNRQPCGQNCILHDPEPVGGCSRECGGGQQKMVRYIKVEGTGDGEQCLPQSHPSRTFYVPCNAQACPPPQAVEQHLRQEMKRMAKQQRPELQDGVPGSGSEVSSQGDQAADQGQPLEGSAAPREQSGPPGWQVWLAGIAIAVLLLVLVGKLVRSLFGQRESKRLRAGHEGGKTA
jgi:hypothetical protein